MILCEICYLKGVHSTSRCPYRCKLCGVYHYYKDPCPARCSYCQSLDHERANCPKKSRCRFCKVRGHSSVTCPAKRKINESLASLRESNRETSARLENIRAALESCARSLEIMIDAQESEQPSQPHTEPCEMPQIESSSLGSDLQDSEQPLQPNEQPMNVCEGELGSEVLSLGKIVSEEPMSDIHLVESPTSENDTDFEQKIQSCDLQNVVSCETKPIEGYETIVSCEQQDYAFDQVYVEYSDEIEVESDFAEPPPISESVPLPNSTEKIDFITINPTTNLSSGVVYLFQVFDAHLGVDPDKHSIQTSSSHQRHDSRTNRFEEGENDACLGRVKLKEFDILRSLILKPGTTVRLWRDFGWDPGITGSSCLH